MRRVRQARRSGNVVKGKPANFNRRKTKGIEGDHLIQCDISGQVCLRSEARMTWRGLLVSKQNWDPKHPQLTINVPPDEIAVANARPTPVEPTFESQADVSIQLASITVGLSQVFISEQQVELQ